MKVFARMVWSGVLLLLPVFQVSCMKICTMIAQEDPCMRAYLEKRKLSHTSDEFERQQLLQQIEVFDKLCYERNERLLEKKTK